jgi:DNA-binding YbaB/EbfC family protein
MFDGLKDMGKMMKQAKEMRAKMKVIQSKLKKLKISGIDKRGLIKVILTGELECIGVHILNDEILKPSNKEMLEKAIEQAMNKAAGESKKIATSNLSEVSGGLNIPGLT